MTEADLEVLSRFAEVWERVVTGKPPESERAGALLEELLQELHGLRRGYESLSRYALGAPKRRLCALAAETGGLFDRLQTEYFLETGDIFLTSELVCFASYTPYNLRKLWKNAIKLAGLLQKAEEPRYREAGETIRSQTRKLETLIRESLK